MRRRALAGTIDAAIAGGAIGAVVGGWMWSVHRRTGELPEPSSEQLARVTPYARGLQGVAVTFRNVRSPGQRITGLRKIDARTGGTLTILTATRGMLVDAAFGEMMRTVTQPRHARFKERQAELCRQGEARRAELGTDDWRDPQLSSVGRAHVRNCLAALLPAPAYLMLRALTARLDPRHRTYTDRLSGVVVIRER